MKKYSVVLITIVVLFIPLSLWSQTPIDALTEKEKSLVIDSLSSKLASNYIFRETAEKMALFLKKNLNNGSYSSISDPVKFAQQLTDDLVSVSKDRHIRVLFNPETIAEQKSAVSKKDSLALVEKMVANLRRQNFGFKEVKILDGNIGYLDLRNFHDTKYASETAIAAMNFLSNSDALIIDLRKNGGGYPGMIQLLISYLYTPDPVHLNNFYWRPTDTHTQTWTLPHVPGKRRPDIDVYVLTSKYTFSAAEEFSYDLKHLKRATLIGETTGGGAHPGGPVTATDRFTIWVPSGRAINPITNTNWEGTGVEPHIKTQADMALIIARIKALEKLKANSSSEEEEKFYDKHLSQAKEEKDRMSVEK